jgi:hypothetical protein
MNLHPLNESPDFSSYSFLELNEKGRFIDRRPDGTKFEVDSNCLYAYFQRLIRLPAGVTDVFVWVHGWQTTEASAQQTARRLFNGIEEESVASLSKYPGLRPFVPWFVAVHWPSKSSLFPAGYQRIRDRAAAMTFDGEAEFFVAALLGYLDKANARDNNSRVLRARGGYRVHCIGHSFGGRFLAAAILAAVSPHSPRTLSLRGQALNRWLLSRQRPDRFAYNVDSVLVFQMAAPHRAFRNEMKALAEEAPICGPIVLTFSQHDTANCLWHSLAEREPAIGCCGLSEPSALIENQPFGDLSHRYIFNAAIVNVDAGNAFMACGRIDGAHSNFWYRESIHLLLSLASSV